MTGYRFIERFVYDSSRKVAGEQSGCPPKVFVRIKRLTRCKPGETGLHLVSDYLGTSLRTEIDSGAGFGFVDGDGDGRHNCWRNRWSRSRSRFG